MKFLKELRIQDYLSLFRIPAALVLIILAVPGYNTAFGLLFVFAVITDALDGYLARKKKQTNQRGSRLDSAGDATLFLAAITGVIILETEFFKDHLIPASVTLALYFLQLGLAFWRYGRPSSFHTYAAKTSAVVQSIFLASIAFFEPWEWLFYMAMLVSIVETLEEIILIFIFPEPVTDVKGLFWVRKKKH